MHGEVDLGYRPLVAHCAVEMVRGRAATMVPWYAVHYRQRRPGVSGNVLLERFWRVMGSGVENGQSQGVIAWGLDPSIGEIATSLDANCHEGVCQRSEDWKRRKEAGK